jgi:DNA polymerase III epsilon subunit-like protein
VIIRTHTPQAIVFDTETTGLTLHPDAPLSAQPRCIEFGAVLLSAETGEITEEISILINPRVHITEEITKITGLTDEDVAEAGTFPEVLPQIERAFALARTVVAHNLPFDRTILRAELARMDRTMFPWPRREVCTVGLYREDWGRNPKLLELYAAIMGRPLAQTHRALDDARALAEIVREARLWDLM